MPIQWTRPRTAYIYPNPWLRNTRAAHDVSSVIYSADGKYVCGEFPFVPFASQWAIVEDPMPHWLIDGEEMVPSNYYIYGGMCWQGGGYCLYYTRVNNAWILQSGALSEYKRAPFAYQNWSTQAWTGDGWWEKSGDLDYESANTFTPKGTLLNSSTQSKTITPYHPRWDWTDDGFSERPFGKYVGVDGKTGVKYIGAAAYSENGDTRQLWYRKGTGAKRFICRYAWGHTTIEEESTKRSNFRGFGTGWGIWRDPIAYLSASMAEYEQSMQFDPYRWDEESNRYVAASGVDPLVMTYHGRTIGTEKTDGYFTEVAIWR